MSANSKHDEAGSTLTENRELETSSFHGAGWTASVSREDLDKIREMRSIYADPEKRAEIERYLSPEASADVQALFHKADDETYLYKMCITQSVMAAVQKQAESMDSGLDDLLNETRADMDARAGALALEGSCNICDRSLPVCAKFYAYRSPGQQTEQYFICCPCYFNGAGPELNVQCLEAWEISYDGPRAVRSEIGREWDPALLAEYKESGNNETTPSGVSPLSQVMHRYLEMTDLRQHKFHDNISALKEAGKAFLGQQALCILRNWATACFLMSDLDFTDRTGIVSFAAVLSPSQSASFALLKEWWFSEVQDPDLMIQTIRPLLNAVILRQNDERFDTFEGAVRNKYADHYHGAMRKLWEQEFLTLEDGRTAFALSNVINDRRTAAQWASRQRICYAVFNPLVLPVWFPYLPNGIGKDEAFIACRLWRYNIRRSCSSAMGVIRVMGDSDQTVDECWKILNMATDGPIELFMSTFSSPGRIFRSKRLSAMIEPLPWLIGPSQSNEWPHYLWDRRLQRTIETESLIRDNETRLPEYIAISHTWGRWRTPLSIKLPGVKWEIPGNSLWDVSDLPRQLSKVPGAQRYIWFDLVCIPQNCDNDTHLSQLQKIEVAKQAAIFGKATHAVIWLNTMSEVARQSLQLNLRALSVNSGHFIQHDPVQVQLAKKMILKTHLDPPNRTWIFPLTEETGPQTATGGIVSDINTWFTSLWTLQEACMRPDMWICSKDWTPLRMYDVDTWKDDLNISLDAILAVVGDPIIAALRQKPPLELYAMERSTEVAPEQKNAEAAYSQGSSLDKESAHPNSEQAAPFKLNPELLTTYLQSKDAVGTRQTLEEAMNSGKAVLPHRLLGLGGQHLYDVISSTLMTKLLTVTPMDILAMAERRACKRKKQRAQAIMSAVGAVDWYKEEVISSISEPALVLDCYPLAFIQEVRKKVGDYDFFKQRMLNKKSLDVISMFSRGESVKPAGTLLPFGFTTMAEKPLVLSHQDADLNSHQAHSSVADWKIQSDGSVRITRASIVSSSRRIRRMKNCQLEVGEMKFSEKSSTQYQDSDKMENVVVQYWKGEPGDWLGTREDICYLVALSKSQGPLDAPMGIFTCPGVILRELRPGLLVKIGLYVLAGHDYYTFPLASTVDWTVL